LIAGTDESAQALARELSRQHTGYEVIGMLGDKDTYDAQGSTYPFLGPLSSLHNAVRTTRPGRIVVSLPDGAVDQALHRLIDEKFCHHIPVVHGDDVYESITGKIPINALTQQSILFSPYYQISIFSHFVTRLFSLLFAIFALILLAPLIMLVALLVKVDSAGPVLFIQKRIGMGNREFNLYKFRTMHSDSEARSEWVRDNQDRITRTGRWLRRFRLDELPQFVNVIRGDMNLVGPRPHPASNYSLYVLVSRNSPQCGGHIPYYSLRTLVRPGITGWAQVKYCYANDLGEEMEKLRFDLYYIKHYSLWLDLKILLATVKVVLTGNEFRAPDTAVVGTTAAKES